jgi:hypothetical protein
MERQRNPLPVDSGSFPHGGFNLRYTHKYWCLLDFLSMKTEFSVVGSHNTPPQVIAPSTDVAMAVDIFQKKLNYDAKEII